MDLKMPPHLLRFVMFCLLVAGVMFAGAGAPAATAAPTPETRPATAVAQVSRADQTGVSFELRVPAAQIDEAGAVTVAGLQSGTGPTGSPDLPSYSTFIAVPPAAAVSIRVSATGETLEQVPSVQPVPQRSLISEGAIDATALSAANVITEGSAVYAKDQELYGKDAFYPGDHYALSEPMIARDMRLVQLTLYPLRYNAAQGTLAQAASLQVELTFSGAQLNEAAGTAVTASAHDAWRGRVLNYPPQSWRLTPADTTGIDKNAAELNLPEGVPSYKIEVVEDGIYEISGADLAAAGMDLTAVDVNTLQMMHRGEAMAFQFVDVAGGSSFAPQDKIRFYGWGFDGSRYEDMFVGSNFYWLWAGGAAAGIPTAANGSGTSFQKLTSFPESVTEWSHRSFYGGGGVDWDASPNEATPWHIDRVNGINQATGARRTYRVNLPDPVDSAAEEATVTTEVTSRLSTTSGASTHTYTVSSELNMVATGGSATWQNQGNVNAVGSVPGDVLRQPGDQGYPENAVRLSLGGSVAGDTNQVVRLDMHVTRITVEYQRELRALGDELQFKPDKTGSYAFEVSGFSVNDPAQALVWDVSNRLQPVAIALGAGDISPDGGTYRWTVRRTVKANGRVLATTTANLRSPKALTEVVPQTLAPTGGADWVAISHASLLPAAQKLAAHRASQSGLSTWVIDAQQIVDQIGYGYHLPTVFQTYLRRAFNTWDTPPAYATFFGDATVNPRHLLCDNGCLTWDPDKPHLLATDLLFVDRFAGLIPVDYTYALLSGNDLLPDIAIGRVPAQTLVEANNTVANIVRYEKNLAQPSAARDHFLFVADNADGGGNFCGENHKTAASLPATIATTELCLENGPNGEPPSLAETEALQQEMFRQINEVGISIMNYRGHGSVASWATPFILDISDRDIWQNIKRPVILLSADCLDGNFTAADTDGLGETFIRLDNERGTAAHWSSSGLGFTFEHTPLHLGLYEAVFGQRTTALGDAVNYSKTQYLLAGYDESEALAFTLLGDPAMVTYPWQPTASIPVVLAP